MCVYTHVGMSMHLCARVSGDVQYVCAHMPVGVCTCLGVCMYVGMHVCAHMSLCACMSVMCTEPLVV